jgi:hypothetical protein
MTPLHERPQAVTRRRFFDRGALGNHMLDLNQLLI